MKKIVLLTLLPILLAGCGKTPGKDDPEAPAYASWKYYVPVQAPAIAMAEFAQYDGFETTTQPNTIPSMMAAAQYDVVVAPTNVGVNAIKNGHAPYKILATITFGNFFVAATGNDNDEVMDADDYIVSFQQNGIPDKIFHYVYGTGLDSAIKYYAANSLAAQTCLETGLNAADSNAEVDYVVIAEPSLTAAMKVNSDAYIYDDLQSKYEGKSGGAMITQASVFVKNTLKTKDVKKVFMPKLEETIEGYIATPKKIKTAMEKVDNAAALFGIQPDLAVEVTKKGNRMGFGFMETSSLIDETNNFLGIIGSPSITDEDIA